ncbi:MAG TPA: hypothetical protein VJ550_04345 [Geomonas sp.]|nr:hypothetical protein [Geomonas sp.]
MIIDTIYADPKQLSALIEKYPACHLEEQRSPTGPNHYLLMISDENEVGYLDFLLDSALAMSSMFFLRRLDSNAAFTRDGGSSTSANRRNSLPN